MERSDPVIKERIEALDDYQTAAFKFRTPNATPEERVFGVLEEAGEIAGVFKRLIRGDYSNDVATTKLHKELGDVLWYLSQIAVDNGFKLSEVATANIEKLSSRAVRGVLLGSGDER
jgi:NTP pyrophosphatase (non-canonical NTP hydrolase)